MFEQEPVKVFRVTLKEVIKRLSSIEDCDINNFKELVYEKFDGYNYEGEEELVGFDKWEDISNDGNYQLNIKIDHDDAYEFTLHTKVDNKKATIVNVL
jgi:hypothetical protein